MEGELPIDVDCSSVAVESCGEWVEVIITSGRGGVTLAGPLLDVARLIVETDRQLSHLLAVRARRAIGAG